MRKTLMIFLALVLVCGCGTALAAQAVSAPREEILFQEHIFSGDPAAADGLTVHLKAGMRYKLNWESTVQFSAQDYRAETSFRFLPAGQALRSIFTATRPRPAATMSSASQRRISPCWTRFRPARAAPGRSVSRIITTSIRLSFPSIFRALIMTPLSTGRTPQRTANGLVNVHRSRWAAFSASLFCRMST